MDDKHSESGKGWGALHRRLLEGKSALFAIGTTVVISIGGLVEIVPLFNASSSLTWERGNWVTPPIATTNRTMPRFELNTSMSHGPTTVATRMVRIGPTTRTRNSSGMTTFPVRVRLPQARLGVVIARTSAPARTRRAQGAVEHGSERSRTYVSDRAQAATR